MIHIKQVDACDLEVLALLGRTTWIENFGALFHNWEDAQNFANTNFSVATFRTFIENPNAHLWLIYYNDLPVGYAKIVTDVTSEFVTGTKLCKLVNFYVLKDFHSKNIGSLLFDKIQEFIIQLNCDTLLLDVLHTNTKAVNFYVKHNFYKVGAFHLQIGANSFIMHTMVKDLRNVS